MRHFCNLLQHCGEGTIDDPASPPHYYVQEWNGSAAASKDAFCGNTSLHGKGTVIMVVLQLGVGTSPKPTGPDPRLVRHHQQAAGKEVEDARLHVCLDPAAGLDEEMAPSSPAEPEEKAGTLHTKGDGVPISDRDSKPALTDPAVDPRTPLPKKYEERNNGSSQKASLPSMIYGKRGDAHLQNRLHNEVSAPSWSRLVQNQSADLKPSTRTKDVTSTDGTPKQSATPLPAKPPHQAYALISWFDGTGSTYTTVVDTIGHHPTFFIAAEMVPTTRYIVADKHGLDPRSSVWRKNKHQVPSRYAADVWELIEDAGKGLRQAIALFPNVTKYVFVHGSPCPDLTVHSAYWGTLGITGSRSVHVFAIVAALIIIKTFDHRLKSGSR